MLLQYGPDLAAAMGLPRELPRATGSQRLGWLVGWSLSSLNSATLTYQYMPSYVSESRCIESYRFSSEYPRPSPLRKLTGATYEVLGPALGLRTS